MLKEWLLPAVGHGPACSDPSPFGLLTLVVSLEAIFLSTFAMIAHSWFAEQLESFAQALRRP